MGDSVGSVTLWNPKERDLSNVEFRVKGHTFLSVMMDCFPKVRSNSSTHSQRPPISPNSRKGHEDSSEADVVDSSFGQIVCSDFVRVRCKSQTSRPIQFFTSVRFCTNVFEKRNLFNQGKCVCVDVCVYTTETYTSVNLYNTFRF